mmetsp:Transcript_16627/g.25851  ORF Transcript_16627/g.25851 Transcript_16627/m.25851 type:complete len:85 (+) Transcript_16627:83-337(+)
MASTRSKYVPIVKKKEETPKNEIRVTANGSAANYINRARFLFEEKEEKILLKASGNAIPVACTASEVLRHRIKGLAQVNNITNI